MLLRPDVEDLAIIGLFSGRVVTAVGATMLVPAALGVLWGEYADAAALVVAAGIAVSAGQLAEWRLHPARTDRTRREPEWHHGLLVAAFGWLVATFHAALPLYLSGHYAGFVDAYFDAMSGFATAGLSVASDLDHMARSINWWRQLTQFLGGQGLIVIVLSLFAAGGGATGMYVGEAREERILPNVARTSRFIWRVSLSFAVLGTAGLLAALLVAGLPVGVAVYHAPLLFFAAFDTGGFAPLSSGLGFYHSAAVEAVVSVLMVAGALSFAVHYRLWHRRSGEIVRNSEVRLLTATVLGTFALTAVGLLRDGPYETADALFRRGFFQVLSAHTGTGFQTVPATELGTGWGPVALLMVVTAMGLGGMAGSTAGGIKGIRVVLIGKAVGAEVARALRPPSAVTVASYHAGRREVLRLGAVRSAFVILVLYVGLYLAGALAGVLYGYAPDAALFESVSAAAAVGLSVGITQPDMETGLKVVYILQMWVGRLEFLAVFALLGYAWSAVRGRT